MVQPSGLALNADATELYLADSESSALRVITISDDPQLITLVGAGLFDFGWVNGEYRRARLLNEYVLRKTRNRDLYLSFVNFSFFGDEGDTSFGDLLAIETAPVDEEVHEAISSQTLLDAIAELPEQERNVIEMRFGAGDTEPQTLSQAGRKLGVSTERARQIEERALRRLSQRPELIALREAA